MERKIRSWVLFFTFIVFAVTIGFKVYSIIKVTKYDTSISILVKFSWYFQIISAGTPTWVNLVEGSIICLAFFLVYGEMMYLMKNYQNFMYLRHRNELYVYAFILVLIFSSFFGRTILK